MKYQNQFTRDKKRPRYCDSNEVECVLTVVTVFDTVDENPYGVPSLNEAMA